MERLAALPAAWSDLDWQPTGIGLGMLSWWGADHESWSATLDDGRRVIAKAPRPHAVGSPAVTARVAAAAIGVGPDVLIAVPEAEISVELAVGDDWQVMTLLRAQRDGAVAAIADARRRFRESDAVLPSRDLGAETAAMIERLTTLGGGPIPLLLPLIEQLDRMRGAVAEGPPSMPGWLSSEVSDVLVAPDGAVLFTGGTHAGLADPLADVGTLLTELAPSAITPEEAFAVLWGDDHPGAYARARIWGIVADLRAGLGALLAAAMDPTSPVNYAGYAFWRAWHGEHPILTGEFDQLVIDAEKGWS